MRKAPRFARKNTTPSATRKYPNVARRRSVTSGSLGAAGVEMTVVSSGFAGSVGADAGRIATPSAARRLAGTTGSAASCAIGSTTFATSMATATTVEITSSATVGATATAADHTVAATRPVTKDAASAKTATRRVGI